MTGLLRGGWGYVLGMGFLLLLSSGCSGCRKDTTTAVKPVEKPPVSRGPLRVQPSSAGTMANQFKPGHWGVASLELTANRDDLRGELMMRPVNSSGKPVSMHNSGVAMSSRRPLVLPKDQKKNLQSHFWLPYRPEGSEKRPSLESRLLFSGAEIEGGTSSDSITEMQAQEYNFVVLSKQPNNWQFLSAADWTSLPNGNTLDERKILWMRVLRPLADDIVYLPDTLLESTSTAVVLWDDVHPDQLTEPALTALIDWLHWGGKLIINGPVAIDQIRRSRLESLLPLKNAVLTELPNESLGQMVQGWTVPGDVSGEELTRKINAMGSLAGLSGDPVEGCSPVKDSAEMLWRRRVGRGMIVLSRFDLSAKWVNSWRSNSAFFNGAILQLPSREVVNDEMFLAKKLRGSERVAAVTTDLRLFSRDAGLQGNIQNTSEQYDGWVVGAGNSLGEWSANSAPVAAAVNQLRESSGITIPSREFVYRNIGIYLAVLIPANFFIAWLFGRLEWAWALIPLFAILGAGWITRSAQLDIGFARSLNELDLLELHAGHPRGHLTRVMAIYNSLSTTYEMQSSSNELVMGPVSMNSGQRDQTEATGEIELRYGSGQGLAARGIAVPSNRTGIFRVEQMIDLPGTISLSQSDQIHNQTDMDLEDVTVWDNRDGNLRIAVIGPLAASAKIELQYISPDEYKGWSGAAIGADRFAAEISRMGNLPRGAMRLIGRYSQPIAGLDVLPQTSQVEGESVVLVHLAHPELRESQRDLSLRKLPKDRKGEELFPEDADSN